MLPVFLAGSSSTVHIYAPRKYRRFVNELKWDATQPNEIIFLQTRLIIIDIVKRAFLFHVLRRTPGSPSANRFPFRIEN